MRHGVATQVRPKPQVKSAADVELNPFHRILLVGPTGAGKTAQVWTLPGRKFAFIFDPNSAVTLKGCPQLDYVEFLPDYMEMDTALKGFNKNSTDDKSPVKKEPRLYEEWRDYMNTFVADKVYETYDWIVFDSLTFLAKGIMDRQLYINGRYGATEDLSDFKVVGGKFADIFNSINSLPVNVLSTGHLQTYEDDKTKKIVTQLYLPGRARTVLPLTHTNVWEAQAGDQAGTWEIKTLPEKRGLQEIRTSVQGLKPVEDVTIKDFSKAESYGVGALLRRSILDGTRQGSGEARRGR